MKAKAFSLSKLSKIVAVDHFLPSHLRTGSSEIEYFRKVDSNRVVAKGGEVICNASGYFHMASAPFTSDDSTVLFLIFLQLRRCNSLLL